MSASVTVPAAATRNRSIEARRAARLEKFKRERLVIDYLNRGVSVAEIAVQRGVTEKRMRAIVREVLASRMPGPPDVFVALQISRLNEALLVAYSAMSGMNLKAVDRVVKIVRELDRYHGFFGAERRSLSDSRPLALTEAKAETPLALLADRWGTAPQEPEKAQSAPGNDMAAVCHPRGNGDPEPPGATSLSFAPLRPWMPACAGMTNGARREMAPQEPEKAQSAPEKDGAPNSSDEAFASVAAPAQAPSASDAPQIERPEAAPQAIENPRFATQGGAPPEAAGSTKEPAAEASPADLTGPAATAEASLAPATDPEPTAEAPPAGLISLAPATDAAPAAVAGPDPAEEASLAAEAAPPPPAIAANALLPPYARRRPGPTAFTGFIRCAGQVTYCL